MARRKIRNYPPVIDVRNMINEYMVYNKEEITNIMLKSFGCKDTCELRDRENKMMFGFDCGWVYVGARRREQNREWLLDNGKYDAYVNRIRCSYETQSTTLKQFQIDYVLRRLGLDNEYYSFVRLD